MTADESRASKLLESAVVGQRVTRVLIDYSVTLEFADRAPVCRLSFETPFSIVLRDEMETTVTPGQLEGVEADVVRLFEAVVQSVRVDTGGRLVMELEGERRIDAGRHGAYESWSFVDDDGRQVVCLPSGGLAIFGPRATLT